MAVPHSIEWSALSPPSLEIVKHVGLRLSAGYTLDEVAAVLDRERPEFRRHELPRTSASRGSPLGSGSFGKRSAKAGPPRY